MATQLKTTRFSLPQLNTLPDNTLTAMTSITMYIPEFSGTVTIKKAIVRIYVQEGATMVTGNYVTRRIDVSVGGAGATSYTNSNLHTGSGQLTCYPYAADATAHFQANWTTGTSKTLAVSVLMDSSAATVAFVNVSAIVFITYEYDDTQTTQIKTVLIPLDAPVGAVATSKPGAAIATIPALDTELPEASKVYRNLHIVFQGNVCNTGSTVDSNLQMQIDSLTQYTSQTLEMGTTSDYWIHFAWNITSLGMTTNATHGWYVWGSVARFNHAQAFLVVTYEFDATASNNCFVSVIIPQDIDGPMGGPTSADYQSTTTEFWIEEPATITTKQIAFFAFWDSTNPIAGLNFRIGSGSFVAYTDVAAVMCGSNGAMVRNDSAFTLVRGKNTLNFDCYRTDTADVGWAMNGFWIINYTCGKPTQGYGAANHTVLWNLGAECVFDGVGTLLDETVAGSVPVLPESNYFMNRIGLLFQGATNGNASFSGVQIMCERTSGEAGGQGWLHLMAQYLASDAELGLRTYWTASRNIFKRYPQDPDTSRLDIETSRRWRFNFPSAWLYAELILTYHCITFSIAGTLTDFGAGTVNIQAVGQTSKEVVGETSRSGNGAYSMTYYDNTENILVTAYQDSTHQGASDIGVAA